MAATRLDESYLAALTDAPAPSAPAVPPNRVDEIGLAVLTDAGVPTAVSVPPSRVAELAVLVLTNAPAVAPTATLSPRELEVGLAVLTDAGTPTHSFPAEGTAQLAELALLVLTEAGTRLAALSDTGTGTDVSFPALTRPLSDTGTGTDVSSGTVSIPFSDSATGTETLLTIPIAPPGPTTSAELDVLAGGSAIDALVVPGALGLDPLVCASVIDALVPAGTVLVELDPLDCATLVLFRQTFTGLVALEPITSATTVSLNVIADGTGGGSLDGGGTAGEVVRTTDNPPIKYGFFTRAVLLVGFGALPGSDQDPDPGTGLEEPW